MGNAEYMGTHHRHSMSTKGTVTIRPRKLLTNRLLQRRQMILDVHHAGLATPNKETLKEMISEYLSRAKGHKASKEATSIFGRRLALVVARAHVLLSFTTVSTLRRSTSPSTASFGLDTLREVTSRSVVSRGRRRRTVRRSSVAPGRRSVFVLARSKLSKRIIFLVLSSVWSKL